MGEATAEFYLCLVVCYMKEEKKKLKAARERERGEGRKKRDADREYCQL